MAFFSHVFNIVIAFFLSIFMGIGTASGFSPAEIHYEAAEGNPLKGFVPFFSEDGADNGVPYSMEFFYIPLSSLLSDSGEYTLEEGLEPYLEKISERSHQAIFRIYLDYPASDLGEKAVPQFIWDMGVKKYPYTDFGGGVSPDYTDDRLIEILVGFIKELGKKYDGDKRIAFITAGLIGHWGEWHCFACTEAAATDEGMRKIADAYANAFSKTKILMRYPGTPGTENGDFGYHDDSFTYETLGKRKKAWFFFNRLKKARQTDILNKQPIGGEFRPEGQLPFLQGKETGDYQHFDKCVNKTHCSWLINETAFGKTLSDHEKVRARSASVSLGYDLTVTKANVRRIFGKTEITVAVKNVGVAPVFSDAKIYINAGGREAAAEGKPLRELLPGETFFYKAELTPEKGDIISVSIKAPDTLSPISFSNVGASSADGSLVIGKMD